MGKRILTYIVYSFILSLTSVSTWAEEVVVESLTCGTAFTAIEELRKDCLSDALKCKASVDSSAVNPEAAKLGGSRSSNNYGGGDLAKSIKNAGSEAVTAGDTGMAVSASVTSVCRSTFLACKARVDAFAQSYSSSISALEAGPDGDASTPDSCLPEVDAKIAEANAQGSENADGVMVNSIKGNLGYMNRKAGGGLLTFAQANMLKSAGSKIGKIVKGEAGWASAAFYGAAALGVYKWHKDGKDKKKREEGEQANGTMRFSEDGNSETCFTQVNGEVGECFSDTDLVSLCDGLTQSSANFQSAMNKYGAASLDLLCKSSNVTAARAGAEASDGNSGTNTGETCDSSSPTYYTTSGCTNQMLSTCTSDINYGDCGKFYEDYCLNSGARGAGSNFCVYQASKDYCNLAGTSAASPACGWVNYIANNVAICGANLEQYACYPAQLTQAEYSQQCSNLGVGSTDPLCANLDNTTFNTAWRNPATPSSATASGTAVAGSDASLVNDTNSIGQTELPTNDVATNDFCAIPDNFYNPNCLNSFCGNPQNSTSPICVEYQGVSNAIQASSSPSRSVASVLPADIQAVRTGSLLDADGSGITARMCRAGLLADCGPLAGVR